MKTTIVSDEGALHTWQRHCRDCPLCDHNFDNASPEDAAAVWIERVICPCDTISVIRCAGCHQYLMYVAGTPHSLCGHYGTLPKDDL